MADDVPTWHSPALEGRIARADAASAAIKSFNEYVNAHGFRVRVAIDVNDKGEKLVWGALVGRKDWGLAHEDGSHAEPGGRKACVLIESVMAVRIRMAKLLPQMLQAIDQHVAAEEEVDRDAWILDAIRAKEPR